MTSPSDDTKFGVDEFDKSAAIEQAKHEDSDGYFGFLTGAEWQFEKLQSVIQGLRDEIDGMRENFTGLSAENILRDQTLETEIQTLKAEKAELTKALQFYESEWTNEGREATYALLDDRGKLAREVLNKQRGE